MIRFGIIGCGSISEAHAKAVNSVENAEIIACCDIDVDKGKDFSTKNDCLYFDDYKKLLADERIDVVVIGTPHYLHCDMTIDALKAGKNVICEKPMALSLKDAERVQDVVQRTHKKYAVCYQNRFNESFIEAQKLISHGGLGKLLGGKCILTWHRTSDYYTSSDWKGRWETEGGGVLINQAIHSIDAMLWLSGHPTAVKGKILSTLLDKYIEVEDSAIATVLINDEIPLQIMVSNDYSSNPDPEIIFDFEKANIVLTAKKLLQNEKLVDKLDDSNLSFGKDYWGYGHEVLFKVFCDDLLKKNNELINYLPNEIDTDALKVVQGIYESNKSNDWVDL